MRHAGVPGERHLAESRSVLRETESRQTRDHGDDAERCGRLVCHSPKIATNGTRKRTWSYIQPYGLVMHETRMITGARSGQFHAAWWRA